MRALPFVLLLTTALLASRAAHGADETGARVIEFFGYDDCILLENDVCRAVLCPASGGRVLEYSTGGTNALYLPDEGRGWTIDKGGNGAMNAGRFDIGPEMTIPAHPRLWAGPWTGEITGPRSARLVSENDEPTGARLVRDFVLDEKTTRLACTQTIENVSDETVEYCHWCRTFAVGQGIVVIPRSRPSRFPNGWVRYDPAPLINAAPEDPNVHVGEDFIEIVGPPKFPKLGFDTTAGWFAYLMPNDLVFVKRYPVDADRVYNEVAGLTLSIWYPDRPMCELEPIGPRERIAPGKSASFTETWWLLPREFPEDRRVDPIAVAEQVARETVSPP